jgi:hypothetical protein
MRWRSLGALVAVASAGAIAHYAPEFLPGRAVNTIPTDRSRSQSTAGLPTPTFDGTSLALSASASALPSLLSAGLQSTLVASGDTTGLQSTLVTSGDTTRPEPSAAVDTATIAFSVNLETIRIVTTTITETPNVGFSFPNSYTRSDAPT